MAKQLYFNLGRINISTYKYKENKTPWQLACEKVKNIDISDFPLLPVALPPGERAQAGKGCYDFTSCLKCFA